jgi:CrcB protein
VNALWVFLGGGVGSVARFWISTLVERYAGAAFPWAILVVNVTGSFLIGVLMGLSETTGKWTASSQFRAFFIVGVCGGYTTFSTFSLQTLSLLQSGQWAKAGANAVASVVLCLAAVWLGHTATTHWNFLKPG